MTRIAGLIRRLGFAALSTAVLLAPVDAALAQTGTHDDRTRAEIAPRLQHLRDVARQRQQVRVIARLKPTGTGTGALAARIDNSRRALRSLLAQHRIQAASEFTDLPLAVYTVSAAELDTLLDSDLVEQVDEDGLNYPTLSLAVPFVKGNVPRSFGYTGNGATVAILDTGVDSTHPDFGGRVVAEACYSTTYAAADTVSLCPGGVASTTGTGTGAPCAAAISWACEHGTHVASIAAGSNATAPGIAPAAKIIAIQVFSQGTDPSVCGTGITSCVVAYDSDVIKGLNYIYSLRNNSSLKTIASVNLSLGGSQYTANCDTSSYKSPIDQLRTANIATVIASGNNGFTASVNAPGCVSTAITVGSVGHTTDVVSSYSNSLIGLVDMLAPGENITAAVPGGSHATLSGTSMATPFITGAFAILKGINSAATMADMEARLKTYGTPVVDSRNGGTFPRLNLELVTASIVGSSQVPTLTINSPANNAKLAYDKRPFILTATATDVPDGNLNSKVTWRSSKDGAISSTANLSLGAHTLTASVIDSNGFSQSASVNVSVLNAPTVTITAPASGVQQLSSVPFVFTATASDIESGNLAASVQWSSNLSGSLGSGATLSKLLAPGTQVITASVVDGDGMPPSTPPTITVTSIADANNNGMADSWESQYGVSDPNADPDHDGLTNLQEYNLGTNPTDAAPTVVITAPASATTVGTSTVIHFAATASDREDGNLGASIQWRSSISGVIGSGATLDRTLPLGNHTITAVVTDSKGAQPVAIPSRSVQVVNYLRNGDVNGDGKVDMADALRLQQYLDGTRTLSAAEIARADLYPASSGDGQITLADLLLLEKLLRN